MGKAAKSTKKASMKKVVMKKTAMKKTAMKKKAGKLQVFRGSSDKTSGGLKKTDLKKSKTGKIVSASMSNNAQKNFHKTIKGWLAATKKARAELKVKGFVAIKKDTPLYKKAKEIYDASK